MYHLHERKSNPIRMRAPIASPPRPDPHVSRWIARELASSPPRAPSLTITVWGDAIAPHGGAVMLPGLIRLLEPFGINERLTRTSVFRLARERWLVARRIGRRSLYRLTPAGAKRFEQAHRRRLPQIPAPFRRCHRAFPSREFGRPRSRAVLYRAHAADP